MEQGRVPLCASCGVGHRMRRPPGPFTAKYKEVLAVGKVPSRESEGLALRRLAGLAS